MTARTANPSDDALRESPWLDLVTRHFWAPVLLYFALQAAIRVSVSPELGMDDAELVLLTRSWAWGYGSQPPLYTWLLASVFAVFGETLGAVVLTKNALLAATYIFVHRAALRIFGGPLAAATAALSLMFIPQIAWESQRALSHTVLAVAVCAAALLVFVRLVETRRTTDYLLFAVLAACGALSKLNALYFFAALVLAAAAAPTTRTALVDRRSFAALSLGVVMVLPTALWMSANPEDVTRRVEKFALGEGGGVVGSLALGVADFVAAVVAFLAPLVVIYLAATVRAGRTSAAVREPAFGLLVRALAFGLLLVLATVVLSGATNVKDRWLQPVLFFAPLVLAGLLSKRLPPVRLAALGVIAGLAALVVMVALPVRIFAGGSADRFLVENRPFAEYARQLRDERGFTNGTIIASDYATGGNLAMHLPGVSVLIPEYGRLAVPTPWPALLVWSGASETPPPALAATLALRFSGALGDGAPATIAAPAHHGDGALDTLHILRVDQP